MVFTLHKPQGFEHQPPPEQRTAETILQSKIGPSNPPTHRKQTDKKAPRRTKRKQHPDFKDSFGDLKASVRLEDSCLLQNNLNGGLPSILCKVSLC